MTPNCVLEIAYLKQAAVMQAGFMNLWNPCTRK